MPKRKFNTTMLSQSEVDNIRKLVNMAGGVKYVAGVCGVSVDKFNNPLRGMSSDFTAVNLMVSESKKIITQKVKELV